MVGGHRSWPFTTVLPLRTSEQHSCSAQLADPMIFWFSDFPLSGVQDATCCLLLFTIKEILSFSTRKKLIKLIKHQLHQVPNIHKNDALCFNRSTNLTNMYKYDFFFSKPPIWRLVYISNIKLQGWLNAPTMNSYQELSYASKYSTARQKTHLLFSSSFKKSQLSIKMHKKCEWVSSHFKSLTFLIFWKMRGGTFLCVVMKKTPVFIISS